jgi:hypothetical protein
MTDPETAPMSRQEQAPEQPRPFFLGTCRVHGPAEALRRRGHVVYATPNRLHTPMQTLQLAEHLGGRSQHFTPETVHLLSDFAMQHVVRGRRDTAWSSVLRLRTPWRTADVFFIEISSFTEFPVPRPDGSVFYANNFTARDMRRYAAELAALEAEGLLTAIPEPGTERLSSGRVLGTMRRIKSALRGRPVIWLSHVRPPEGDPAHAHVIAVRSHVARVLREGAAELGDGFFDPSTVAAELGTVRFFAENGTDLGHFTDEAIEALATHYARLAGLAAAPAPEPAA